MSESRVATGAALVIAVIGVASAISPTVEAWLSWAMGWVLGVGVGGPVAVLVLREVLAEISLSMECRRYRPPPPVPAQPAEVARE